MRLLEYSDDKFKLTKDLIRDIPAYAILSHTWGLDTEEVTYKDLVDDTGNGKTGYEKIRFCAAQTRRDGLRYFWVDTCCIDKSNNNELSEAINCMFRWYQNAARCYVYLADVLAPENEEGNQRSDSAWESAFRASKWFTRGWTLQELLAPASVEFFTKDGHRLGDKRSLEQQIHHITGIDLLALGGSASLTSFDVEERFKWAETRQTTREEDWAYCLLGIFVVFMPLLYGEGKVNAVRRLKQEITNAISRDATPKHQEGITVLPASSLQPPTSMLIWNDTAEVSPLVASIGEVSSFGFRLSKRLKDYGSAVVGAEKRLSGLDNDISFTSGILSELGTMLNDARVQALISEQSIRLTRDAVAECDGIFQAMEGIIAIIRKNGLGKLKMYFRDTKIELLRSNLDRMKGNLTLLMGVINQATQISLERPTETTLAVHRQKIRELMIEKEAYTQRYLAEKHKYDALLAQVNSTSTLGSISTKFGGTLTSESGTICLQPMAYASAPPAENADAITPCIPAPGQHVNNLITGEPPLHGPLKGIHASSAPQNSQAGSRSNAHALMPVPPTQSPKLDESTIESTQPNPGNSNKALEIARKVAKGAVYVLKGTAAVIFFPITMFMFIAHRKRKYQSELPGDTAVIQHGWNMPDLEAAQGSWDYSSYAIPAELPAVHELSGDVEMQLVSELTQIPRGYTGPYELGGLP